MPYFNIIAETNENTVVTEYTPVKVRSERYQSEAGGNPHRDGPHRRIPRRTQGRKSLISPVQVQKKCPFDSEKSDGLFYD